MNSAQVRTGLETSLESFPPISGLPLERNGGGRLIECAPKIAFAQQRNTYVNTLEASEFRDGLRYLFKSRLRQGLASKPLA